MIDKQKIKEITHEFLLAIGEDPNREGLIDTPSRVANMLEELLTYKPTNNSTSFKNENYQGIILVRDIDFASICEHHLLPFLGKVHIAYIPDRKIIGLSKLVRIVEKNSKKLQIQEKLSCDIIEDITTSFSPKGIALQIIAKHLCMNIRGATNRNAETVTNLFSGDFLDFRLQEIFINMINK